MTLSLRKVREPESSPGSRKAPGLFTSGDAVFRPPENKPWPLPKDMAPDELWQAIERGEVDIPRALQALRHLNERLERVEALLKKLTSGGNHD